MIKEALWLGLMDGIGMVIIGHRSSKSTFGATNIVIYTQERRINDFIYVSVISEDFIQKRHP